MLAKIFLANASNLASGRRAAIFAQSINNETVRIDADCALHELAFASRMINPAALPVAAMLQQKINGRARPSEEFGPLFDAVVERRAGPNPARLGPDIFVGADGFAVFRHAGQHAAEFLVHAMARPKWDNAVQQQFQKIPAKLGVVHSCVRRMPKSNRFGQLLSTGRPGFQRNFPRG